MPLCIVSRIQVKDNLEWFPPTFCYNIQLPVILIGYLGTLIRGISGVGYTSFDTLMSLITDYFKFGNGCNGTN